MRPLTRPFFETVLELNPGGSNRASTGRLGFVCAERPEDASNQTFPRESENKGNSKRSSWTVILANAHVQNLGLVQSVAR